MFDTLIQATSFLFRMAAYLGGMFVMILIFLFCVLLLLSASYLCISCAVCLLGEFLDQHEKNHREAEKNRKILR